MAEDVVEHVGFLDVIEGLARADEIARGETPVGQVPEEHVVGDQHGHGDHAPPGQRIEVFGQCAEFGHAPAVEVQFLQTRHERGRRAAGQHGHLPRKQIVPDRVVFGRIVGLFGFEPVVAHMRGLLQRRGEHLCRKVGQAGKVLFGLCKCSHMVGVNTIIAACIQMAGARRDETQAL